MPILEPQYATRGQQRDASVLGMWVFLATEVLIFGGILTAFFATRLLYPRDFEDASGRLNVLIGGINTLVLLASSLTMALAVHSALPGGRNPLVIWLGLRAILGTGFLGLKGYEYFTDWRDGLVPMTARFVADGWPAERRGHLELFMIFYFVLTGLHAVHLTVGIGLVGWLLWRVTGGGVPAAEFLAPEVVGLYWHFVDVVWIVLLPILYLSGHHDLTALQF
jgi:cytochrome c oxidase subunit 3